MMIVDSNPERIPGDLDTAGLKEADKKLINSHTYTYESGSLYHTGPTHRFSCRCGIQLTIEYLQDKAIRYPLQDTILCAH